MTTLVLESTHVLLNYTKRAFLLKKKKFDSNPIYFLLLFTI